jgi:hypothetical protein
VEGGKEQYVMVIFLLALIGTLIVLAVLSLGRLWFGRSERFQLRAFLRWLLGYFIFNYLFSFLILYFGRPALTGPFWGWQWVFWPLLLSSVANLIAFSGLARAMLESSTGVRLNTNSSSANASRGKIAAGILGLVIVAALGIVASILIGIFTTWFDGNAKALAAIPNVTVEENAAKLPPTDPNHIVLVSSSVAAYKGQQVLGSNGQNLGSAYQIDPDSYTLQSINHHLYFVAQLSYNNIFVNLTNPTTPGFVMVDAENPQAQATLHTGNDATIAVLPGGLLNQDLLRHVYLNGYTYGNLLDPTLELDDSLHPYWTISLMQPSRGYTGNVLQEVLIINAHTGEIKKYAPKDVPTWVDRVMPAETINQYLEWWGLYHDAPWFNPSGAGQQKPASDPELLYNSVDDPVWLIPVTSAAKSDNSSTGVFLFDTHSNTGHFYPKVAGLGIGDNVTSTFKSTRDNIRNYSVSSVQLYQIFGAPTWVAIYVQSANTGSIYQAVGLVDARELNGSNVQFAPDITTAMTNYQQWLVSRSSEDGNTPGTGAQMQTITAKVERISWVQQGSSTIYYLQVAGQKKIFTANLTLSPELPLVHEGDKVTVQYLTADAEGPVVNVKAFDDLDLDLIVPTTTPGGTPTPAVTVTATPSVEPTKKP